MTHVFGPVPSRRLGRSLGIDLVPFKTCSYDCIYCQLGRTTHKTAQRAKYVSWEPVVREIERKLSCQPDYITLSGSGEPTLHTGLDELIGRIRAITQIPIAALTNGSLLWRADVRRELRAADLVIPSLDAGDELRFRHINRPHDSISFARMLEGLVAFRQEFSGPYWLEVFLLSGYTAIAAEVDKIAACIQLIRPDRVQLNTVTRPPAESYAEPVSPDRLSELAGLFEPRAEIVADYTRLAATDGAEAGEEDILELLRRRPCTARDIGAALGLHINHVLKCIEHLSCRKLIEQAPGPHQACYRAIRLTDASSQPSGT